LIKVESDNLSGTTVSMLLPKPRYPNRHRQNSMNSGQHQQSHHVPMMPNEPGNVV
jgi:hypothetical protein